MERAEIIERMKAARIAKAGRNAARRAFATKTWIALVGDMINGSMGEYMAGVVRKLQRVKFTIEGDMLKENMRRGKRGTMNRAYEYAIRHYPTMLRMFEASMKAYDAGGVQESADIKKEGE